MEYIYYESPHSIPWDKFSYLTTGPFGVSHWMIRPLIWHSLFLCQSSLNYCFGIPLVSLSLLIFSSLVEYFFVTFDVIIAIFFFIFTYLMYLSFCHFRFRFRLHFQFKFCFILNSTWVSIIIKLWSYLSYLSSIRLHSSSSLANEYSCVVLVVTVSSFSCSCFFFCCFCCCCCC